MEAPAPVIQARRRAVLTLTLAFVLAYVTVALVYNIGVAMFILVPSTFSAAFGVYVSSLYPKRGGDFDPWKKKRFIVLTLALSLFVALALLFAVGAEGLFCVLILGVYAAVAALPGVAIGYLVGRYFDRRGKKASAATAFILLLATPFFIAAFETSVHNAAEDPVHELTTDRIIDAPPERVWFALNSPRTFDAERPPTVRAFHAPTPDALSQSEQDRDVWRIQGGHAVVTAHITERRENQRLAFDYGSVEQLPAPSWPKPERFGTWLTLVSGSFELTSLTGGRTRLSRTTRYQWHLHPELGFLPLEVLIGHGVHSFALASIGSTAESLQSAPGDSSPHVAEQ